MLRSRQEKLTQVRRERAFDGRSSRLEIDHQPHCSFPPYLPPNPWGLSLFRVPRPNMAPSSSQMKVSRLQIRFAYSSQLKSFDFASSTNLHRCPLDILSNYLNSCGFHRPQRPNLNRDLLLRPQRQVIVIPSQGQHILLLFVHQVETDEERRNRRVVL